MPREPGVYVLQDITGEVLIVLIDRLGCSHVYSLPELWNGGSS